MMGDPWATYDASCEFCEDDEGCGRCDKQIADDLRWSTDPRV